MNIKQTKWTKDTGWVPSFREVDAGAQLVLVFGSTECLQHAARLDEIRTSFPAAEIIGCSTAGEICGTEVSDSSLVATAVRFDATQLRVVRMRLSEDRDAVAAGESIAKSLPAELVGPSSNPEPLRHVFVLSDGLQVNGSDLASGITRHLPGNVTVTGGLAGDGARFGETRTLCGESAESGVVCAVGLYGKRLKVGFGSMGGWDPFGPERLITRSEGNVLYELDGRSALELYKKYLGEHSASLPSSGLLFPLSLRCPTCDGFPVVRTILNVDERKQSMTFAGDVPEGSYVRLMKASFDRLIDGAVDAAKSTRDAAGAPAFELAILISCVGRKLVLKQRIEEEVEGVRDVLGRQAVITGFYSYGEIAPFTRGGRCELHNQTMTITTLAEP